jgi:hypothetical protein
LVTTITKEPIGPRLLTRAEVLALLKIGETTLFWLQRTGKLKPIRIGSRVLFSAGEIGQVAARGATLTEAEKEAARQARPTAASGHASMRRRVAGAGRNESPEQPA